MTAIFPNGIYQGRGLQNRNGVVYDVAKKKIVYAEDINDLATEVEAVETYILNNVMRRPMPPYLVPSQIGQLWIDSSNNDVYISKDINSLSDWIKIT